jgi:hypothetical protein
LETNPPGLRQIAALSALATASLFPTRAHADRRSFAQTYEAQTNAQGVLELEFWNAQIRQDFSEANSESVVWQLEVEYGITDHWDAALYQEFEQGPPAPPAAGEPEQPRGPLSYGKTKLETRYLFADRGVWPIDVVAYFEVAKPVGEAAVELVPKLILGRTFGKLILALNAFSEIEIGSDGTQLVPGYAVGVAYELHPTFRLGAESWGSYAPMTSASGAEERKLSAYAGPSLSWFPSPSLFAVATPGFGLTEPSADLWVQIVVGVWFL